MSTDSNGAGKLTSEAKSDTAIQTVRAAVLVGATQTDVDLPAEVPIGSLMFDVINVLGDSLHAQGKDVSVFRAKKTPGRWTFAEVGAPPMPSTKTLSEIGVEDGTRLVLLRVLSDEEYQPLVDDVTDGVAMITDARFLPWDAAMSRLVGGAIAVLGFFAVAVLIGLYAIVERSVWVPSVVALVAAAAAVGAARLAGERFQNPTISAALILGGYLLAGVGAAVMVPGDWGAYHAVLSAGALVAVAVVSVSVLQRAVILAAAVITVGSVVLAAAWVRALWSTGYVALGTGITLAALLILFAAPKLSAMAARVPLPPVPTLGVGFDEPDRSPRFIVAGASGAQQYKAPGAEVFEKRATAASQYLTGIIIGAALCLVAGTALATQPGHRRYWMAFTFSALVAAVILRRARIFADRRQSAVLLASGAVVLAMLFVRLALADGRLWVVLVVACGLLLAAGATLIAGVVLPEMHFTEVQRRIGELFEVVMIAALPILAVWIMDVYGALRGIR